MKPTQLILPAVLACCSALCCCGSRSLGCSTFLRLFLVRGIRGGTFPPCLRAGAVHRRLACRYWAGRVALRENRARQDRLAGSRRSETARPKLNLLKSSRSRGPGGAPLQPVPGVRPSAPGAALLGQHARGVVCSLYAPLAGG